MPNLPPFETRFKAWLLLGLLALLWGCSSPKPPTGGNLPTRTLTGHAELPPGSGLEPSQLKVSNLIAQTAVSSTGDFTLETLAPGSHLALLERADGQPILLGWLDDTRKTISARSTAEVLVFLAIGGPLHPSQVQQKALEVIPGLPLDGLTQAVAGLVASPEGLLAPSPAVLSALQAVLAGLHPRAGAVQAHSAVRPQGFVIQPLEEQSGVRPFEVFPDSVYLTNSWRRRAWAFFERVSTTDAGGKETPSPAALKDFMVLPVTGLNGGFIGTSLDIFAGNYAGTPVDSEPVSTPNLEGARKTTYKVTVVGAGFLKRHRLDELSQEQYRRWILVSARSFVEDLFFPLLSNFILGTAGWSNDATAKDLLKDVMVSASADAANLLSQSPQFVDYLRQGKFQEILDLLLKDTAISNTLRASLVNAVKLAALKYPKLAGSGLLAKLNTVVNVVGAYLQAYDTYWLANTYYASSAFDTWTVEVDGARVWLDPKTAYITKNELQLFKVHTEAGPNPPALEYRWSTSGKHGLLGDTRGHKGTSFTSSDDAVNYTPNLSSFGSDTISVEVLLIEGNNRKSLGSASAEVSVDNLETRVSLVPRTVSLLKGESVTLKTTLRNPPTDGGTLSYRYSTSGNFGGFAGGLNHFETSSSSVSYQSRTDSEGSDTARVEVFSTKDGVRRRIGSASATLKTEKRKTILQGSWFIKTDSYPDPADPDGTRHCIAAYMAAPADVSGAKQYTVRGYNFFDPLYYLDRGASGSAQASVTYPGYDKPCAESPVLKVGGQYWFFLSGGHGPNPPDEGAMKSRFEGMEVEVSVIY